MSATIPSVGNRDMYVPATYASGVITNITVGGSTMMAKGGALQQAAGYEGVGKGIGGGGAFILYDIYAQHIGKSNSESIILVQWRHIIGKEGECIY